MGIVEEYGLLQVRRVQREHHIFGEPQGRGRSRKYDIPAVATLPMDRPSRAWWTRARVEAHEVGRRPGRHHRPKIVATCEAESKTGAARGASAARTTGRNFQNS